MWKAAVGEPLLSAEEGRQGRVKGVCVGEGAVGPEAAWGGVGIQESLCFCEHSHGKLWARKARDKGTCHIPPCIISCLEL